MSAVETLRSLAIGARPRSGLLHAARLEAFGAEAYGEEAIIESFRRQPTSFSEDARVVASPGHVAIFDEHTAIFADVSGENIARIWRLGEGQAVASEPAVSVTFDPDLAQERGDVFFNASDHPALAGDCVEAAKAAGHRILSGMQALRARAFAVRAFGDLKSFAALFAIYRLSGDGTRTSGVFMASAFGNPDGVRCVVDVVGQVALEARPWTPRIAA
jgi:hypothetical protein